MTTLSVAAVECQGWRRVATEGLALRRADVGPDWTPIYSHARYSRWYARLIEHHRRMFVIGDGFCKAVEQSLHRRRIGIGHYQCEGVVRARFNGSEDVGEGEALVAKPRRTLAALPPDVENAAFLTGIYSRQRRGKVL
ncbi:MAG: hypothetical protein WBX25_27990 [Rhodomicrobium sp.]